MATFNKVPVEATSEYILEGQMKEIISEKNYEKWLCLVSDILQLNDTRDLAALMASVACLLDIDAYSVLMESLTSVELKKTIITNTLSDPAFRNKLEE